mmetsp:Transcript_29633/g.42025  ORF Transcript_29633/g.42025 Transcript_29633/m.42025 type:complete len:129 (-) Transcript_29633:284-670(-)
MPNHKTFSKTSSMSNATSCSFSANRIPGANRPLPKKMMRVLSHRPPSSVCRYVQLSNVGHCPNHEAPKAVAKAVSSWIAAGNQPRTAIPPLVKPDEEFREDWAVVYAREMKEQDIRVGLMDLLAVTFV